MCVCFGFRLFQEFPGFEHLRVVLIEDMIYIVHVREFAEFVRSSLKSKIPYIFCDIGQEPIKVVFKLQFSSLEPFV